MINILDDALDVRCDYEKAAILGDEDGKAFAFEDAFNIGHQAYRNGLSMPVLLKSVPDLKKAWTAGWYTGRQDEFSDESE
ncbi:hypothetical protein D3X12_28900 [Pseudomonas protegens]|uniref:Uncharacterized protein n=1 Tax=Pseudomonas protegens TaxID=380021 RepID=A0ABY2VJY8_9PSED|nr:hypothetical protein [Pseudomonas protegens]ASE21916.1 hypothetical protein CEP86_16065 [Pseudomonas protegens]OBZ20243.1 hypothetical protein BBH58_28755 [Pseudomonas protegens]OBZ21346.1 hypothetical protein BBH57_28790 [Pseudomonas protegens]OKK40619.1 hypothetical protein BS643_23055 [Pseudomonas protegens]OKK52787.1 hypothetical protein BS644_02810 [Pseudomonas protegens]